MSKDMPDSQIIETFSRQDRDTIIRLDEKQGSLLATVNRIEAVVTDLKNNTVDRISKLESERVAKVDVEAIRKQAEQLTMSKANHSDIVDLGTRIDTLENYRWWIVGVGVSFILLSGIIISLITYIYFSDLNQIKTELQKHVESTQNGGASK